MRVERIELRNFRNYEHLVLTFDQARTLLLGENGTGKSTIIDAIEWCLTGHCRGVNAKGEGQKDLIRNGSDGAEVSLVIAGIGPISRTVTAAGGASSSMKTEVILGRLKTSDGMLTALLHSRVFFEFHHADAKALLMQALDVTIPKADLPDIDLPFGMDGVDLGYLDTLYKNAFEHRTVVKRQLAAARVPEKPKVVSIDSSRPLETLQRELSTEQDTHTKLVRAHADADHAVINRELGISTAVAEAESVATLEGALTVHNEMLVKHQGELKSHQAQLEAAQAQPAEPVDSINAQMREYEILIDKLGKHDPDRGCVLSASIPCLTKGAEFAGSVDKLRQLSKDMAARVTASTKRQDAITTAQGAVRESERHVTYHTSQIDVTTTKLASAKQAAENLKTLRSGLPALKTKLKDALKAMQAQREQVDQLVLKVAAVAEYTAAMNDYQTAVDAKKTLETEVAKAEAAVKLLGPTGVRVSALKAAMDRFEPTINAALKPFGFSVTITPDPWAVTVTKAGGEPDSIRFEMLSKGQQLWTGLAFQVALARVSGLSFLVVDDVEAVVGANRQNLTGVVMTSGLEQVLVAMAVPDGQPAPVVKGLQVVRVDQVQVAA